jgi:hypothetical protein
MKLRKYALGATLLGAAVAAQAVGLPQEHGRKYKPPPPTAHVVITVVKGFNGKPFANAGVVFRAIRDGKDDGNLEVKTDPDGHATIDVLEVGSHVLVQVIANGFATYATEFDLTGAGEQMLVKLQRPQAQVSTYEDNDGKVAQTRPGTQVRVIPKAPATPTTPKTAASPETPK